MFAAVGSPRFRPHLTMHEFEAWVFAAGEALAELLVKPAAAASIAEIANSAGGAEFVNDVKRPHHPSGCSGLFRNMTKSRTDQLQSVGPG